MLLKVFSTVIAQVYLTHWLPVYEYIVLGNKGKPGVFRLTYQLHSSSAYCGRELFKPLASLRVCNAENIFWFGFRFFVSDVISEVVFGHFWPAGT